MTDTYCRDCGHKVSAEWASDYPTMVQDASTGSATRWGSGVRCPKCDFKHANLPFNAQR